ncbi:type II secretion system F family protein [Paraburkholderia sp. 22099]|jgi:tight adherence protein C|uniref:type II secretion system F family protein n=1 Tax=Paraburkholderia TaxID=1822464 RepID=UPI002855097D|nr:type II secretion system F family protein [Paraburkholderia terricola]MDR6448543.1 tight adherence protein C [Paraburkholderia terricola]MDR6494382.1 tight adherence protein C [Paraburkholderia terricola]
MSDASIETLLDLLMLVALFGTLALWWAAKRGGRRGRIAERVREAAVSLRPHSSPAGMDDDDADLRARLLRRLATLGDRLPLFDAKYRAELGRQMVRGGYRGKHAVPILVAIKFLFGIVCATLAVMLGSHIAFVGRYPAARGILMVFVFIVGMIVPEYVLALRAQRRRLAMAACLPDALDLLVICTNAGNSLAVSIRRVADELASICPPLSDEFSLTADELKLSGDSTRALNGLAQRIDLPAIRALISTLTQSMRYGTPITQALRTLSRTERLAHIVSLEEKAAKLAPKMVLPMMLFILPAVVVIAAGPAIIQILEFFAKQ